MPLTISPAGEIRRLQSGEALVDADGRQIGGSLNFRLALGIIATALAASGQISDRVAIAVKTFNVLAVLSNLAFPVRLRVYSSAAFRDADASRSRFNAPVPGSQHGVIMDLSLTAATGYTWVMSPIATGETTDNLGYFYYTVDNLDIVPRDIDLDVTYLAME
jgi:hypothetical protein